jgi:predicted dehydrogenase
LIEILFQHNAAALRTLLPPLTHLSAFSSLNKDYLAPQDTIHVMAKADGSFHGLFDLTFASPTKTVPTADGIVVTGTEGWLAINRVGDAYRTTIKSMVKHKGKPSEEVVEIIDHGSTGVQAEFQSFFDKVAGIDGAEDIGNPEAALRDVAFIEAALKSNGTLLDLNNLVQV